MNRKIKISLLAIAMLVVLVAILWIGIGIGIGMRSGVRQAALELDNTQAMLAFNRLVKERQLASFLSKGCTTAAAEQVDIRIDQDMKLLSSFTKGNLSPWVIKYINDRDPTLLSKLAEFKSKYGESWKEPECAP